MFVETLRSYPDSSLPPKLAAQRHTLALKEVQNQVAASYSGLRALFLNHNPKVSAPLRSAWQFDASVPWWMDKALCCVATRTPESTRARAHVLLCLE